MNLAPQPEGEGIVDVAREAPSVPAPLEGSF
jgi:hypothetical protein